MLNSVIEIAQNLLEKNHPFILAFTNSLAQIYIMQGRADEAQQVLDKAIKSQIESAGEVNRTTLTDMKTLRLVYMN